nr:PREDICTED: golgin subfamily A member 6-like protein 2 [Linepithema humile]
MSVRGARGKIMMRDRSVSVDEMWKRRREEGGEGEEEVFRTCKKTMRSPERGKGEGEGIENLIRGLMEEVKEMKINGEKANKELKEKITEKIIEEGRRQEQALRKEVEDLKRELREMREREESWRKEGERWEEGLKKVEGRVENMEKRWEEKEGEKKRKVGEEGKVESRVRELERKLERREREERKKNVIVKELKVGEGGRREAVERLMAEIGAKVEIEEMRGLGRNIERGTETLWVKLKKKSRRGR